jgi:peptide/nickel transport system ATP-binding protein
MGVVADMADRVAVMLKGEIVESGDVYEVLNHAKHPYTQRLLAAVPHLGRGPGQFGELEVTAPAPVDEMVEAGEAPASAGLQTASGADHSGPIIEVDQLVVEYRRLGKPPFRAVDEVSFAVAPGEIVGLVGESGSGKSTIAMCALGLIPAHSGSVKIFGQNMHAIDRNREKALRRRIGVVFQDPASSLNPRFPIGDCIAEPLVVHKMGDRRARLARVTELLDAV